MSYLKVKSIIENWTGFSIYRNNTPWGSVLLKDITRLIPEWSPQVIFDVGANIGQTATAFKKTYPDARILSFEPVKETFKILEKSIKDLSNVDAYNLGLGSVSGEAKIKIFSNPLLASLDHEVAVKPVSVMKPSKSQQ